MKLTDRILSRANTIEPTLIKLRRQIHEYPELGSEISKTADMVIKYLKSINIEVIADEQIGVVGILRGSKEGRVVLLRADMDALPITESEGNKCCSKYKNRMHACGHDAHTAWLLGAATILADLKEYIHGTVKFAFQPCEEGSGGCGAREMLEAGILNNPKVDVAVAAHVFPEIPVGKIGIRAGGVTATPGIFSIKIIGKGGHASEPSKCIDPIMILNQIYTSVQTIQRMTLQPDSPSVISITQIHGGEYYNVIPDEAKMSGTIRTFSRRDNEKLAQQIRKVCETACAMHGAVCEFEYRIPIGSSINDRAVSKQVSNAVINVFKSSDAVVEPPIFMGGDDFSYYTEAVPSCYFFVGVRNESENIIHPIHNEKFDLDESCLAKAAAIMAEFTINYLE